MKPMRLVRPTLCGLILAGIAAPVAVAAPPGANPALVPQTAICRGNEPAWRIDLGPDGARG